MTLKEIRKALDGKEITLVTVGDGDTVTGQLPIPGEELRSGGQLLLYLGEPVPERQTQVPDFHGMNRQQASDAAGKLGLFIAPVGNQEISPTVTVSDQREAAGTVVNVGTTITLQFTDTSARD